MSKSRKPQQPKVRSAVAVASFSRGNAGVHSDQRKRACAKSLRRDKSYRDDR